MDSLRELYLEYCKTYNVDAQECVKVELKRLATSAPDTQPTLNFSSHHISDRTLMILGKLLAHDQKIINLKLNDCSLSDIALKDLCNSLSTNGSLQSLELKGNNVHGDGTQALAKLLRQNTCIRYLSLEWNSLGLMDTNAFAMFCESLALNRSLHELDLRNNQITHTSASELCVAIERNTSLKTLDLRWNCVGLVGGKALLASLKKNHTLTQLMITGNSIPDDVCDAIQVAISHNNEQHKTQGEFNQKTSSLTRELQQAKENKDKHVSALLNRLDIQEETTRKMNRALTDKMKKLQEALEDRSCTMNALASKLSLVEADLAMSEQKCLDLQNALTRLELDKENKMQSQTLKFKHEKEHLNDERVRLEKDLNEITMKSLKQEDKIKELERKCDTLTSQMYDSKEKLAHAQAEYQIKMATLDEESRRLKQKHRDELKEYESLKQRDLERLKEEQELNEKDMRDRVNKLEFIKHSLEDELSHLKTQFSNQKITNEKELQEQKARFQLEEIQGRQELEDKLRNSQASRQDLEMRYNQQNAIILDYQQKNSCILLEVETLKRNNDSQRSALSEKENELIEACEKLKTDHAKRLRSIQKDIDKNEELKTHVFELENRIKEIENDHKREISDEQRRVNELREKLASREAEIERLKNLQEQTERRLFSVFTGLATEFKTS